MSNQKWNIEIQDYSYNQNSTFRFNSSRKKILNETSFSSL